MVSRRVELQKTQLACLQWQSSDYMRHAQLRATVAAWFGAAPAPAVVRDLDSRVA